MKSQGVKELSSQLREIARGLSFLGHPRFPLKDLYRLFPQHKDFIDCLEDISTPFPVDVNAKRMALDIFMQELSCSTVTPSMQSMFSRRVQDYRTLLSMMENFHTPEFYPYCINLYGTSHKLIQNNSFLYFLEEIPKFCFPDEAHTLLEGDDALKYLKGRLAETFNEDDFEVNPSSSLLSDSSAGRKGIKLNLHKAYSTDHLDVFVVHEGWVHLGTSLNGAAQPDNPWLSTWAPRTTFLQEGLAIVIELITGHMTLERWNKVVLRHLATNMAERGSPINDVYAYLRHHGLEDLDAFKLALRIFRGVPMDGGMAFTKELLYLHGMIELLYHMHVQKADLRSLWVGKLSFDEHIMLLKNWDIINPGLKYFPKELDQPQVLERLQKLKELSFSLFKDGFL